MDAYTATLNKLLGRTSPDQYKHAVHCVNELAGTAGLDFAKAMNALAGTTGLDVQGAANAWAGTTGLGLNAAIWHGAGKRILSQTGADGPVWRVSAKDSANPSTAPSNLGTAGAALDAVNGSVESGVRLVPSEGYVYFPNGAAGQTLQTPHVAGQQTGDVLDIRLDVAPDDWTPAVTLFMAGKATSTSAAGVSWDIGLDSSNAAYFGISDGTSPVLYRPAIHGSAPFVNGQRLRLKYAYTRDTGGGQYAVSISYSTDFTTPLKDITSWTSLASTTGTAINATQDLNAPLTLGSYRNSTAGVPGKYYGMVVKVNGVTTTVIDCANLPTDYNYQTQFRASSESTVRNVAGGLSLPGISGNNLSVETGAELTLTGSVELLYRGNIAANTGGFMGKCASASDVNGTFAWYWNNGNMRLAVGNGTSSIGAEASNVAAGTTRWYRAVISAAGTGGDRTLQFFHAADSTDVPSSWTQIGTDKTLTAVGSSLGVNTLPVRIGALGSNITTLAANTTYRAMVKHNGTTVLDIDCSQAPTLTGVGPAWTCATGQTVVANRYDPIVTVNDNGRDSNGALHLSHSGTNYVYLPGAGNYLSVPAFTTPTADLRVAVKVAMDDWTPAANANLVTQFGSSAATQGWRFAITATTGVPFLAWLDSGQTSRIASATAAPSITDGSDLWLDVTLDLDNGGQYNVTFRTSSDGSSWTQLGNVVVGSVGPTSIQAISRLGEIGSRNSGNTEPLVGKVYHAIVQDGGTTVLDVDTSVITSGAGTSFTALTGQTVTINRGSSGRKTVAVVAPCWLFGTDDYMEVADNDLLDFAESDSFTVLAIVRKWANAANTPYVAKKVDFTAGTVGWYHGSWTGQPGGANAYIADGSVVRNAYSAQGTSGALGVAITVRNATADTITGYLNGVAGTPVTDTTTGSLANAEVMRVGRLSSTSATYADMEFFAAAVWRRALTAWEIGVLSDYYAKRTP